MAANSGPDVLVVGAGVSGLTVAISLVEAGFVVRIVARDLPQQTTSSVAGASWGPYLVEDERALEWSRRTHRELESIAATNIDAGVRLVWGVEAARQQIFAPTWAAEISDFRLCSENELPAGYVSGWAYTIPLVDMPRYLRYLVGRLGDVPIDRATLHDLAEVVDRAPVVVNCTGMGARELVSDGSLRPTRGQLAVVRNPGLRTFFQDNDDGEDLTYILPHGDHVVLGGCASPDREDLAVDTEIRAGIIDRCARIAPSLRTAPFIGDRVGLRPGRPEVRLDREDRDGTVVIHNYGHGGSGVTLSWGCAREVVGHVENHLGLRAPGEGALRSGAL